MSKEALPTVFISHGPPSLLLEDVPARDFLKKLGSHYKNVEAIICISAHWITSKPKVIAVKNLETIHDFYGFPSELYKVEYSGNGDVELALRTANLLNDASVPCDIDYHRGLDHGAWVPLMLMFPEGDVPVFQLSIQEHMDPEKHYTMGRALESLRNDGVLILGSGGAVHPLGYATLMPGAKTDQWALDFDSWLIESIKNGDDNAVKNYRQIAPYPERAHPYPDHFMPLLTCMGAAGKESKGEIIHESWFWGDLGMGAYEFGI